MLVWQRSRYLAILLVMILLNSMACSESVHSKRVPAETLLILEKEFMMSEVLTIAKMKGDQKSVTSYFNANQKQYKYIGSQDQGEMNLEGYGVTDLSSPVIGYSLFFDRSSDSLVIIDTTVNPLNKGAVENAMQLIRGSLDSVSVGDNSKLYFLGIHDLGRGRILKLMVREATTSIGSDYAIRYAISYK